MSHSSPSLLDYSVHGGDCEPFLVPFGLHSPSLDYPRLKGTITISSALRRYFKDMVTTSYLKGSSLDHRADSSRTRKHYSHRTGPNRDYRLRGACTADASNFSSRQWLSEADVTKARHPVLFAPKGSTRRRRAPWPVINSYCGLRYRDSTLRVPGQLRKRDRNCARIMSVI